jgi:DNA-binding response OmpR family regulator
LIVEDDVWTAENHARVLMAAGYKTAIAPHAISAIHLVDDFKPDVIILDILLTGSTAFALMNELQSYSDTGMIPVVICSNLASDLDADDLSAYGIKRILDKSTMEPDDIVAAVRSVL